MKPTFKNTTDWEKADILMQPAFIRVMDNLRKELEKTNLVATYEDIQEPFLANRVRGNLHFSMNSRPTPLCETLREDIVYSPYS